MNLPARKPLRIAFLGVDENTPELIAAVAARHYLVGFCEADLLTSTPQVTTEVVAALQRSRRIAAWETLLDHQFADAVIVARDENQDLRAEQLRKLIQEGISVLVAHPVVDSMLVYYELDMIRRDTGAIVVPYLPWRLHPGMVALAVWPSMQGAHAGRFEQLVFSRAIAEPTRGKVLGQFARDVDLVRCITGEISRLGSLAAGSPETAFRSLGVQMSGPANVAVRWSVDPTPSSSGATISLLGTSGKAVLTMPEGNGNWRLETTEGNERSGKTFGDWAPAETALAELELAIAGGNANPSWVDAARNVELAETIERSLKKGRTIELYDEDYTEENTFKGTMTSLGCALLLGGLFLLGAVAIGEQVGLLPYLQGWPYLLLGLLGLFLLLQTLMLVFYKPDDRREAKVAEPEASAKHD